MKIEIPEGYEIDKEKSTFEDIVFKEKGIFKEKEKLFLELFQGLQIKSDKKEFPDSVFYFRGDTLMLEIEKSELWVNYEDIWGVFVDNFGMDFYEIQSFIKEMVEKHFDWKELTPTLAIRHEPDSVEKNFNN